MVVPQAVAPSELAFVRVAALSADSVPGLFAPPREDPDVRRWLSELWSRPQVRDAIRSASTSLSEAVERADELSVRRRQDAADALWRYVSRMAFRPTPLGLFAGVGIGIGTDDAARAQNLGTVPVGAGAVATPPPPPGPDPIATNPGVEVVARTALVHRAGELRGGPDEAVVVALDDLTFRIMAEAQEPRPLDELLSIVERRIDVDAAQLSHVIRLMVDAGLLVASGATGGGPVTSTVTIAVLDRATPVAVPRDAYEMATETVDLLREVSATVPYPRHLMELAERFVARYGELADVPLLDCASFVRGVGLPAKADDRVPDLNGEQLVVLGDLIQDALREGVRDLELTPQRVARLRAVRDGGRNDDRSVAPAVDAAMLLGRTAPDDAGQLTTCLSMSGVNPIGWMASRFLHGLPDELRDSYVEQSRRAAGHYPGVVADVRYRTRKGPAAVAGLFSRVPLPGYEIPIGLPPCLPAERVIDPRDILVGVADGRFYLSWGRTGAPLFASQGSMVRTSLASPLARFLIESSYHSYRWAPVMRWGQLGKSRFLPGLGRGRARISLARWYLDHAALDGDSSTRSLARWCERLDVPDVVSVRRHGTDQYLVVARDTSAGLETIASELRRHRAAGVTLEDATSFTAGGYLADNDGPRATEVVITVCGPAATAQRRVPAERAAIRGRSRMAPPAPWQTLRFTVARALQNEFVASVLPRLRAQLPGLFWTRGTSAEHRICVTVAAPYSPVLPLLDELLAEGAAADFAVVPYRPDAWYGGAPTMRLAHETFAEDSSAVEWLLAARREVRRRDPAAIAVCVATMLIQLLGPIGARRLAREVTADADTGGRRYREIGRDVYASMFGDGPLTGLRTGLESRHPRPAALAYAADLAGLYGDGSDAAGRALGNVLRAHCRRLGLDDPEASQACGIVRRCLDRRYIELGGAL